MRLSLAQSWQSYLYQCRGGIPRIPHSQIARSAIMNRGNQINLWYVLFAVMGVVLLRDLWVQTQTVESIPYSQFESYLERDVIEKVEIGRDRKSTRLNSSHVRISYAVFCLKKKTDYSEDYL